MQYKNTMSVPRVIYDYQVFDRKYGGTPRYFVDLILALSASKICNITCFTGLYLNHYIGKEFKDAISTFIGYRRPYIPKTGRIFGLINREWFERFEKTARMEYDIYHPTYYYVHKNPSVKCKRVVTVHDMIPEKFPGYIARGNRSHYHKREAVERADAIIAVSKSTKSDLIELFNVPPERVHVVYHGNPMNNKRIETNKNVELLPKPYILFVGRRAAYKNFMRLIQAFSKSRRLSKDFNLLCFGGGPFTNTELQTLRQSGIMSKVFYLNGDDNLLRSAYQNAEVLAVPSLYEGFGFPVLEAMSIGCVVASSNRSSLPEVLGDAGYLFDPQDSDEMKDALLNVLYDSDLRKQLITRGILRAKTYSWEKCAKETLDVYRSLL